MVQDGPKTSISFGVKAEPPNLPCREDVLVENGAASPKLCLPSLEMRATTVAGGLAKSPQQRRPPSTSHFFSSTRPRRQTVRRLRFHTSRTTAASGTCLLPLPAEGSSRQNQEKIGRLIQAVLKVVSTPARFLDRGARCFVVRLCVLEQLDKTATVLGESTIRNPKAVRRAVRAKHLCRTYSDQFAGSLKLDRL